MCHSRRVRLTLVFFIFFSSNGIKLRGEFESFVVKKKICFDETQTFEKLKTNRHRIYYIGLNSTSPWKKEKKGALCVIRNWSKRVRRPSTEYQRRGLYALPRLIRLSSQTRKLPPSHFVNVFSHLLLLLLEYKRSDQTALSSSRFFNPSPNSSPPSSPFFLVIQPRGEANVADDGALSVWSKTKPLNPLAAE